MLGLLCVLALSYCTYMHNYQQPDALFWDENYHIAAAQKYIHGIHFMEPHPPLGKLLVAAGEVLLHPNEENDQFIGTDHGKNLPKGHSYAGYRFFPALLGWLTAPLLYGIFYLLTGGALLSVLLSFLYIFDTALIVHSRGAMLDSTLVFFFVATVLSFLFLTKNRKRTTKEWIIPSVFFGLSMAGAILTKATGLIVVLFIPYVLWILFTNKVSWRERCKTTAVFLGSSLAALLIAYIGVWQVHFSLATTVNESLPDRGYYQASDAYKEMLDAGTTGDIRNFPTMWWDSMKFLPHYSRGVPRLNLAKEDETGSPWFFWPFGARSINYRWTTSDGSHNQYLYLQSNPAVWFLGLVGVVFGFFLIVGPCFLPLKHRVEQRFYLVSFLSIYVCYLIAIAQLDRVMYLYHYFIPLLLSFLLFGIVLLNVRSVGRRTLAEQGRLTIALLCSALIFVGFQIYQPLSYYQPIEKDAVRARAWFPLWELTCAGCDKESMLVVHTK